MPDLLSGLNPQQIHAVTASPGPTLVLAGPGSGKTRVLTHRIAYLVQQGTPPYRIMAVTFTNKAAREMRERVEKLLGGSLGGLTIGTFHAICARFLRREAANLAVTKDYVIFDDNDQLAVVKRAMERLKLDEKQYRPAALLNAISKAKNELITSAEYRAQTYFAEIAGRVYVEYQKLLRENNALDFDDLLMEVVLLFREHADVLAKYQQLYDHVLVDEFQDTNTAQYVLLKQLTAAKRNLFVVGDPDQCLPPDTPIRIPGGTKPIEKIEVGDKVIAASGRGSTMLARVNHVEKRQYHSKLINIATRSGRHLSATPNHVIFARLGRGVDLHYVYLMYRKDKGCRIGIARHVRSDGVSLELQIGLKVRGSQEGADRIWVLQVCDKREEAYYWEAFYAFRYGVPTSVFHVRGRRMRMSQSAIDRLYANIDTVDNAKRLLDDLGMDWRFPHYIPQGIYRNIVNLRYFGDSRRTEKSPWHAHRIDLWSNSSQLRKRLRQLGYKPRKGTGKNWRIGFSRLQYDDAQSLAATLCKHIGDSEIITGAFLVDGKDAPSSPRFSVMPASHLRPSMIVAIENDGGIIEDEIVGVSEEDHRGTVYDLEVDTVHNYIAGGVVVHNSIYRWRGADYRNVRRFQEDHPDAITILLEQNYRSTQLILDTAMAVIDRNTGRTRKQLFTERDGGVKIQLYEAYNEEEEAQYIVDMIAALAKREDVNPGDVAIMYRTNAQSRPIEDTFIRAGLPYRLVGATRFYARREVKDLLAFLRLVHNPADTVSLMRVINVPPRGLGAKTLEALQSAADAHGVPPSAILRDLAMNGKASEYASQFTGKAGGALAEFGQMLNDWIAVKEKLSVVKLIDRILKDTDYQRYINDGTEEGEDRWDNVMELRGVAVEDPELDLTAFLEQIALVSEVDNLSEEGKGPTLLTLHAAKGLEFAIVFITGLDDGVLPHQRSFEEAEEMAEERRLMYVGLTRAKDRLFLTRAFRRSIYGDSNLSIPSRFLADIPDDLVNGHVVKNKFDAGSAFKRATTWEPPLARKGGRTGAHTGGSETRPYARPNETEGRFRSGQRVKHPQFGEGMVIESKGGDDDEIVIVAFEQIGIKRLAASVAELKILKG